MHAKNLIIPLILLFQGLPSAQSYTSPSPPSNSTGLVPPFPIIITGSDTASHVATTGFVLNHLCLNVNNLTASIEFYTRVFGMRLIFTFRATERMSITYLAHSHGGKNGTAYQTTSELNRNKNNMEGLLELLHYDYDDPTGTDKHPSATELDNTFSHLGIVVPDIRATQKRLQEFGVPVLKGVGGEATEEFKEAVANAFGIGKVWRKNRKEAEDFLRSAPGVDDFIFLTDPDKNLIEIQPQELQQLPV